MVYCDSITPPLLATLGNNHARITARPIPRICHCESRNFSPASENLSQIGLRGNSGFSSFFGDSSSMSLECTEFSAAITVFPVRCYLFGRHSARQWEI